MRRNLKNTAVATIVTAVCAVAACRIEDPTDRTVEVHAAADTARRGATTTAVPVTANVLAPGTVDWPTLEAEVAARADSVDRMLRRVRALTRREQTSLRRDVNAVQISRARRLGVQVNGDLDELVKRGRLMQLADGGPYWTLYQLNFSVPYVTPSTHALLTEIGQRFQQQLDSVDVPHYRLVITSALRTADRQAALRRANSNASKIESAHEFGTTVDIAYRRFAPPIEPMALDPALGGRDLMYRDSVLAATANLRAAELQALLGRVLQEMKEEGKVMVMMERQQTVYHITVARALTPPRAKAVAR